MSLPSSMKVYEGRAIAAPMVRVSCLSYRILCNKHGAGGCFTEELVALKLKKSIREVVTFPVPLTLLPTGFRLLADDVEKAIIGAATPESIYTAGAGAAGAVEEGGDTAITLRRLPRAHEANEDEDDDVGCAMTRNSRTAASSTVTSIYLFPPEEDPFGEEDDTAAAGSSAEDDKKNKQPKRFDAIGDTTCGAYDLIPAILTACDETADTFSHAEAASDAPPTAEIRRAIAAFRNFFGIPLNQSDDSSSTSAVATTVSAEALVAFLSGFNIEVNAAAADPSATTTDKKPLHFLPPSSIIAHVKAVEFVQYDGFKKGYRRATAASFLPKSIVNPFPEGDSRPECERWGSVFFDSASANGVLLPRHNDLRCAQVICQLGASNPTDAAESAAVIAGEVDGIDVNMGCPKAFSIQNGMGAALMKVPLMAGRILRAIHDAVNNNSALEERRALWRLVLRNVSPATTVASGGAHGEEGECGGRLACKEGIVVPISFKTRIFGTTEESVKHLTTVVASALRQHAEKRQRDEEGKQGGRATIAEIPCPLHAITLHARTRPQRSETDPLSEQAQEIMSIMRNVHGALITSTRTAAAPAEAEAKVVVVGNVAEGADACGGAADATASGNGKGCEANKKNPQDDIQHTKPHHPPNYVEDEGEDIAPLMSPSAPSSTSADGVIVPLSKHINEMTFIFNGSVAANAVASVPAPTFAGALLGRSAMWDPSVFSDYKFVPRCAFACVGDDGQQLPTSAAVGATSRPVAVTALPHIAFHELLAWAIPLNWGLPTEWLSMRKKITDLERHSLGQLGRVFVDVIRYFASYRKNTMYLKYYFTRTFSEFPIGKFTFREIEFLLLRDEDIVIPEGCEDPAAERDRILSEHATYVSKLNKNVRGHAIAFTAIQSPNTWSDFYVALKRFEACHWGTIKERNRDAPPATYSPAIHGTDSVPAAQPFEATEILAKMSDADRFIFSVMQRGDEVISEIPKTAFLRK